MGPLSKNRTLNIDCAVNVLKLSPLESIQVHVRGIDARVNRLECYFYSVYEDNGRGERIRTSGPCLPKAERFH